MVEHLLFSLVSNFGEMVSKLKPLRLCNVETTKSIKVTAERISGRAMQVKYGQRWQVLTKKPNKSALKNVLSKSL